jgi:hypothetical protein
MGIGMGKGVWRSTLSTGVWYMAMAMVKGMVGCCRHSHRFATEQLLYCIRRTQLTLRGEYKFV